MFKVSEFAEKAGVTVRPCTIMTGLGCSSQADGPKPNTAFTPIVTLLACIVSAYKAHAAIAAWVVEREASAHVH
jgi:hypothetical protein